MQKTNPQLWLDFFQKLAQELTNEQVQPFMDQVASVHWPLVAELVDEHVLGHSTHHSGHDISSISPADFIGLKASQADRTAALAGEKLIQDGHVGVVIVAGGQGSRLGFNGPKGVFPIGAVTGSSLFYFHTRKILAISRKYSRPVPLLIMTSPENDAATRAHFEANNHFGLNPEHVRFFTQGQMPAVDRVTGWPLFSSKSTLALSPDGHGGALYALSRHENFDSQSALDWAERFGVKTLFYFQVDNPLVKIADPAFLGLHAQAHAEVSFKVVSKQAPDERVGVVCQSPDGRKLVIEYSDLPANLAEAREPSGELSYRAGSIAVHLFQTDFLKRLATGSTRLPFHKAIKKVSCRDPQTGQTHDPETPNAIKFEAFIFDTLPLAERSLIVETDRREEFEPLKNATGPDSPSTVRAAMTRIAANQLVMQGVKVPLDAHGQPLHSIELDPCFMFDQTQLKAKLGPELTVSGDICLTEERD